MHTQSFIYFLNITMYLNHYHGNKSKYNLAPARLLNNEILVRTKIWNDGNYLINDEL